MGSHSPALADRMSTKIERKRKKYRHGLGRYDYLAYLCTISSNANHSTMTRKPVIIMLTAALLMSVAAWGQSLPKFKFG